MEFTAKTGMCGGDRAKLLRHSAASADATPHPLIRKTLALLVIAAGCGSPYDAAVDGVVTLDGTPLPRGKVGFNPISSGPTAYGLIEDDGGYAIQTGREDGLPAGDYAVTVVANAPSVQHDPGSGLPPTPGKPIAPLWYRSKSSTPLSVTVEPGTNEINLDLNSEAPPNWVDPKQRRRRR